MVGVAYRRSKGIFYLIYWIGECGVRRHWRLVCNNHSPARIYGGYLLRTGVYCGTWRAPGAVSACCIWHMCWLYVVLRAHLCLGYMCCGVFGAHLVQEGSGPCKMPNFSHLTEHICIL